MRGEVGSVRRSRVGRAAVVLASIRGPVVWVDNPFLLEYLPGYRGFQKGVLERPRGAEQEIVSGTVFQHVYPIRHRSTRDCGYAHFEVGKAVNVCCSG